MNGERRDVHFRSNADVIRDIEELRAGYTQTGNWSLPQICWHLNIALNNFCKPLPHPPAPPVSDESKQRLAEVLSAGKLQTTRIDAPQTAIPPSTCGDSDIDTFIETLRRLENFSGPYTPHRIFGPVTSEQGKQLTMIHCAHHLSFLTPMKNAVAVEG